MRIMTLNTETKRWEDHAAPHHWIRVEVNGAWFDLRTGPGGGLQIMTEHALAILPGAANHIEIRSR